MKNGGATWELGVASFQFLEFYYMFLEGKHILLESNFLK